MIRLAALLKQAARRILMIEEYAMRLTHIWLDARKSLSILLAAGLTSGAVCSQPPPGSRQRFLSEAPKKWAEYRQRAGTLQGHLSGSTHRAKGEARELVLDGRQEIKQTGMWTLNK